MDPLTLKYTRTHEWLHVDDDVVTIGISDFAIKALTDLVYIDLPEEGTSVMMGTAFGEVESVKAVSDLYSPVTGEVIEVNGQIADDLDVLSNDPYGRGWLVKIQVTDASGLDDLLDRQDYEVHCEQEAH